MSDSLDGLRKRPVFIDVYRVWVKPLSIGQVRAFTQWREGNNDGLDAVLKLVVMSLCDVDGVPLLASIEDAAGFDAQLINGLCGCIVALNGLGGAESPKVDSAGIPVAGSSAV